LPDKAEQFLVLERLVQERHARHLSKTFAGIVDTAAEDDGPGFGVEVNEAVLHRFPWKSGAACGIL